jgi:YbbR domain-containing protein
MEFIRIHILKDYKLKALSLVLAAMLWVAISYIGESKMTVSVPVAMENLRKDLIMEKMETDSVLVTIGGPISILKNLRAREIKVAVNLSGAKEGAQVFALAKDNVMVPKGVKVEEVKPDYMAVEIDKAVEKRLKVVVKLDERWAGIYGVKTWYPQYVVVEGSEDGLKDRHTIETVPVNGDFKSKEEEIDVPLAVKGIFARKIKPETVRVRLRRS